MSNSASYGSFKSPISAEKVASKSIRFSDVQISNQKIYFLESNPLEGGREALLTCSLKEKPEPVLDKKFSVKTRVHEYGGGAFLAKDGFVFFVHDADQNIYQFSENNAPFKITSQQKCRYADLSYDRRSRRIFAVREEHLSEKNIKNTIVSIALDTKEEKIIVEGDDFYSNPEVNEDGFLTYLSWSHPNMPWDGTYLWICEVQKEGFISNKKKVAGGKQESIFQPRWHRKDLYFISDRTGWWNLYRYKNGNIETLWEKESEFGLPQWVFGLSTYDVIDEDHLVCSFYENGKQQMGLFTISKRSFLKFNLLFDSFQYIKAENNLIVCVAASTVQFPMVIVYDWKSDQTHIVRKSEEDVLDEKYCSRPKFICAPSNNSLVYAFFYPPKNDDYIVGDEKPPLIVKCHGGPTSFSGDSLNYQVQYWTSRGFAFVDVNYGGSTGFGRAYRERLKGNWGVVDVQDCVSVVQYLIDQQWVDPNKVAIRGGSAGGYTALACLTFTDQFFAGTSYYGVSDLEMLIADTHKFESRYLDGLVGPYPERKDLYIKRSPIHHIDQIDSAILLLQGAEDRVVPPNQSETMFLALKKRKIPTAYLLFEGERHGFRKSETIKKAIQAEYYFYRKVFHISIPETIEPIQIEGDL